MTPFSRRNLWLRQANVTEIHREHSCTGTMVLGNCFTVFKGALLEIVKQVNFKMWVYSGNCKYYKNIQNRNTFFDSTVFFYFSDGSWKNSATWKMLPYAIASKTLQRLSKTCHFIFPKMCCWSHSCNKGKIFGSEV